jgi:hypothetical protein
VQEEGLVVERIYTVLVSLCGRHLVDGVLVYTLRIGDVISIDRDEV